MTGSQKKNDGFNAVAVGPGVSASVGVAAGPGVADTDTVAVIVGSTVGFGFFVAVGDIVGSAVGLGFFVAVGDGSVVGTGDSGPIIALIFLVTLLERTWTSVALSKSGALA